MDDGITLEALRFMVLHKQISTQFSLRPYGDSGYGIRFQCRSGGFGDRNTGWLLSEKSKRVRVFAKAETAFSVLKSLGVELFSVDFRPEPDGPFVRSLPKSTPRI